jgi:hypothetical protein
VVGLVVVALTITATGGCGAFGGAPEASRAEMIVVADVSPSELALAGEQQRRVVDVPRAIEPLFGSFDGARPAGPPRRVGIDAGPVAQTVAASAGGVGWARGLLGGAAGVALGGWWQSVRARLLGTQRRRPGGRPDRLRRAGYRLAAGVLVLAAVVQALAACSIGTGAGGGGAPTDGGTAAPGGAMAPTGVPPAAAPGTPGAAAPIGAPIVTAAPPSVDPPALADAPAEAGGRPFTVRALAL